MIILKAILIIIAAVLLAGAGLAGYVCILLKRRPPLALYESRRRQPDFLPLDQIPARQIALIIRQEDPSFYTHPGYDLESIRKARQINRREGKIVLGGSTITQQLAKNLYFRFTRSYPRKAAELLVALALERRLGKRRILEMYVNIIYFGNGVYGIANAAPFYFGKPVAELTLNQMVILSILPSAPTTANPIQHPEVFEQLRNRHMTSFIKGERPLLSQAEMEAIRAHGATCLDEELRTPDDFTRSYPRTIPMINERFGPFAGGSEA